MNDACVNRMMASQRDLCNWLHCLRLRATKIASRGHAAATIKHTWHHLGFSVRHYWAEVRNVMEHHAKSITHPVTSIVCGACSKTALLRD